MGTEADRGRARGAPDVSAGGLLWASLKEIHAFVLFIASIGLAILFEVYLDARAPLWLLVVTNLVLLVIALGLFDALRAATKIARTPRRLAVTACLPACDPYTEAHALILLVAPDGLPADATIAFYRKEFDFERPIGFGTVRHEQEDRSYQVTLDLLYPGVELGPLLDKNVTTAANLSARLDVSLAKAGRGVPTVVTKQGGVEEVEEALQLNPAAGTPRPGVGQ